MDEKIVYWIIGLVIYFYLQSRKRKAQNTEEAPPEPTRTPAPVSFEDLIREIQASRNPQPKAAPPPPPIQEPVFEYDFDYEDEKHREEQRDLEAEAMVNQPSPAVAEYEAGKSAAFNRSSLEETMSLEQTDVTYSKFRVYDKEEKPTYIQELAREFQNRENLKKAFILKEILDRKF